MSKCRSVNRFAPFLHCKNIRMSADIHTSYMYVAGFHVLWARASFFSVDLRMQTYTEQVPLKCGKLATKYPWVYQFTVYENALFGTNLF